MNAVATALTPVAPFTTIISICETRADGEGDFVTEEIDSIEIEAFDAQSAWLEGQRTMERAFDGNNGIDAFIVGVAGPRGWESRPEWIPARSTVV
jgi:hypothetical protein